jgi:hypothetical protein
MAAELITYTRSKPTIEFTLNGDSQFEYAPSGSDTQVQFNDAGEMAGDAGLTFNKSTNVLTAGGFTTAGIVAALTVTATGNISGVDVDASGDITGVNVTATDVITGDIKPAVDAADGIELQNAAGTAVVRVNTTDSKVNIGSAANATAIVDIAAGGATKPQIRLRTTAVAPTGADLTDGCIWFDNTSLFIRVNGATYTVDVTAV